MFQLLMPPKHSGVRQRSLLSRSPVRPAGQASLGCPAGRSWKLSGPKAELGWMSKMASLITHSKPKLEWLKFLGATEAPFSPSLQGANLGFLTAWRPWAPWWDFDPGSWLSPVWVLRRTEAEAASVTERNDCHVLLFPKGQPRLSAKEGPHKEPNNGKCGSPERGALPGD